MACGIYKITNLINGKCYIGQSRNIQNRWRRHRSSNDEYSIHLAFRKYGLENFKFEIIEECSVDKLNDREKYWINFYDSYENGYNETLGGTSTAGMSLTREQVEEITKLLKNTYKTNIEIGKQYSVSENTISGINTGLYWRRDNIDYPIRKKKKGKEVLETKTKKKEKPSKEELFSFLCQINGNFSEAGRAFQVKDNTVRKWCKTYGLPYHSKEYKVVKEKQQVKQFRVRQIDISSGEIIAEFPSISEAERRTKIYHIREASDPLITTRKTAGGYIWKRF